MKIVKLFMGCFGNKGVKASATKAINEVGSKIAENMTKRLTDPCTGIVKLEREFIKQSTGEKILVTTQTEKLADGQVKITTQMLSDSNGILGTRTKIIKKESGESIFGGDKITISKEKVMYGGYGENANLVKEYGKRGLEHTELNFQHLSGNGLNDFSHKAIQDRVYDDVPLSSSVKDMLKNPSESHNIKHSLDGKTNYFEFADEGTNYSRVLEARQKVAAEAKKKAAEETQKAAQEAAQKRAALMPKANLGKVLGMKFEDLKVVEKTRSNGELVRYYFKPGNNKPVIKVVEKGSIHEEWIMNGRQDMLYAKFVGNNRPYIVYKKGNVTQIHGETTPKKEVAHLISRSDRFYDNQYYTDGINYVQLDAGYREAPTGRIQYYDENIIQKNPSFLKAYPELKGDNPNCYLYYLHNVEPNRRVSEAFKKYSGIKDYLNKELVDFKEFFNY